MRVIVCGSRNWTDRQCAATILTGLLEEAMQNFEDLVVVEGCAQGADQCGHHFYDGPHCDSPGPGKHAGHLHVTHEHHPADWSKGRAAGHIRNQEMANTGADLCVAFVAGDEYDAITPGTKSMMAKARKAGIRVWVVRSTP